MGIFKRNKNKLTKRKLLINIAIGSSCALVIAGTCAVIGYFVFSKKKTSQTNSTSPYFTANAEGPINNDGQGETNVDINLCNGADFSKLSCDLNGNEEYFTSTPNPDSNSFTIKEKEALSTDLKYSIKINSEEYGSQDVLISVITPQTPYFTASVTKDTLNSQGDGEAVISITLYNYADFSKLIFNNNGTNFTATKDNSNKTFKVTGTETAGNKTVKIDSDGNVYPSRDVGIKVDDFGDPKILIQGQSVWDATAYEDDSITYKTINRNDGDEITDVTYSVTGLPDGFSFTTLHNDKLIIQGSGNVASSNINVTINVASRALGRATKPLTLNVHKFVNVPVNDQIYTIDAANHMITGFNTTFLNQCGSEDSAKSALAAKCGGVPTDSEFCMDLHGWKIAGTENCLSRLRTGTGYGNVNNLYHQFVKLDFSYTQFQWSGVNSGWKTFGGTGTGSTTRCEFSKAKILDLKFANFAVQNGKPSSGLISTANNTFAYAHFPLLENINLYGSVFATNNAATGSRDDYYQSAYYTFAFATFSKLETLNLSGVIFSASNMKSAGPIWSAFYTFRNTTFTNLKVLILSGAIFAAPNMSTSSNASYWTSTASLTFAFAELPSLENLDMSGAVFAANNMGPYNRTCYGIFNYVVFSKLKILNLSGAVFAATQMTSTVNGENFTAEAVFQLASFPKLEFLNLSGAVFSAPNSSGKVRVANNTFKSVNFNALKELNFSGATFTVANMTTSGDITSCDGMFYETGFWKLGIINFGNCEIGNDNNGKNTINSTCFVNLQNNSSWSTTNKLKIASINNTAYWTNQQAQLNSWFTSGKWEVV